MVKRLFIRAFVFFITLTFALCGFLSSARAQGWVDLGLYGGQIYDIAIDPSNTNHMFAGGYLGGGLYSTTNGGTNWQEVLTGHEGGELEREATFRNTVVYAVKIAPSNSDVIWAAHNYWAEKSTNGGATWTHIWNSAMQDDCTGCPNDSTADYAGSEQFRYCESLAIHPTDPQTVYVGTGGPYSTVSNGAIYKTTDGGTSWSKLPYTFDYTVVDIEIDTINNNIVWAITSDFGSAGWVNSIYRSSTGGTNWTRFFTQYSPHGFYDLIIRPTPNEIFIASYAGIYKVYLDSSIWRFVKVHSTASNC